MKNSNERLLSLDALRGFDMFFIMGGEALILSLAALLPDGVLRAFIVEQMGHKAWHGLAFYDIIFPLFLFLSGVSLPFSLEKQRSAGKENIEISLKIVRRGLLLVLLGCLYNGLLQFDFDNMRYASVLGRIGLAWMFASLIYIWCGKRLSIVISACILFGYWALLTLVQAPDAADGTSSFSMEGSIVGYIDRLLLPGVLHLGVHDPEGILSTFPAIVTAILGIFTGCFVRKELYGYKKVIYMVLAAILLIVAGYLWNIVFPINKNLWSSSFVCSAAGWSLLLFALFYLFIDILKWQKWSFFFRVIGMNSITIYLAQQFLNFHTPIKTLFGGVLGLLPEHFYAVGYWGCYITICWISLYVLYKKKIFLKI